MRQQCHNEEDPAYPCFIRESDRDHSDLNLDHTVIISKLEDTGTDLQVAMAREGSRCYLASPWCAEYKHDS